MGRHEAADGDDPVPVPDGPATGLTGRPEPVAIAAAAQAVLAALVAVGWVQLDDTTVNLIGTAVAAVLAVVFTLMARARVTPVADPILTPDN